MHKLSRLETLNTAAGGAGLVFAVCVARLLSFPVGFALGLAGI